MAKPFQLKIIACDKVFYDGEAESLIFPGTDGQVAIMANHEPLAAVVGVGDIRYKTMDGVWHPAVISDGLITVYPSGDVRVVVYSCEKPEDIDVFRAQAALERAQEQLRQKQSIQEYHISTANMARAMARLKTAGKGEGLTKN